MAWIVKPELYQLSYASKTGGPSGGLTRIIPLKRRAFSLNYRPKLWCPWPDSNGRPHGS